MSKPFNALVELHPVRSLEKTNGNMLEGPSLDHFHLNAASELAHRLGSRIIAIVYAWVERGRAYSCLDLLEAA